MELRSLRHVVVLARLLSFTKAAAELNLTQSALTRSIQVLEQSFNVRLFDRDRSGVRLTSTGRDFARRAEAVIREADALERHLSRTASGEGGEIAIGMAPLPAKALLLPLLTNMLCESPEVRTSVSVGNPEAMLQMLRSEKIEFFVCVKTREMAVERLRANSLGRFPTSLLVRSGHPLLTRDPRWDGGGRRFPLVASAHLRPAYDIPSDLLAYMDTTAHVVVEDYDTLSRLTQNSDAIWISSTFVVSEEIRAGALVELRRQAGLGVEIMIYSHDQRSRSPLGKRIIEDMRTHIRALHASGTEAP
jgi:DNA-binding transcriptional LysR family regulator